MAYVLRFVQRFRAQDEAAFMALESEFEALERRKGWPRGRRCRPLAGREPVHTLVWKQLPYFLEAWTEIYERLDFGEAPRARRRRAS